MKRPFKDIAYVGVQIILFIAFALKANFGAFALASEMKILAAFLAFSGLGVLIVAILQLKTNLTAFPSPKAGGQLVEQGLFRYVRHPIYTGIIVLSFSLSFYSGSYWRLIVSVLLLMLFYFKSSYEEQQLTKTYPNYPNYKSRTGRFFPNIFK